MIRAGTFVPRVSCAYLILLETGLFQSDLPYVHGGVDFEGRVGGLLVELSLSLAFCCSALAMRPLCLGGRKHIRHPASPLRSLLLLFLTTRGPTGRRESMALAAPWPSRASPWRAGRRRAC
eukprot:scaffold309642_cov26-Tisochrysis_lutea.AAC.1